MVGRTNNFGLLEIYSILEWKTFISKLKMFSNISTAVSYSIKKGASCQQLAPFFMGLIHSCSPPNVNHQRRTWSGCWWALSATPVVRVEAFRKTLYGSALSHGCVLSQNLTRHPLIAYLLVLYVLVSEDSFTLSKSPLSTWNFFCQSHHLGLLLLSTWPTYGENQHTSSKKTF